MMRAGLGRAACALVLVAGLAAGGASAQSNALGGLLGGLKFPGAAPSNNRDGSTTGNNSTNSPGPLGKLLNMGNSPVSVNLPAAGAQNNTDLIGLLRQSVEDIDEPKEIEIGRHLAAVLLGAKPLDPNMALQRYVNRLGRWIALQSPRPDLPWTFAVLDDHGFNAFAAPGGYIFVTRGLVDLMHEEAQLAGVLAHEINHVVFKHHLKAIQKSARSGLLTQALAARLSNGPAAGLSAQLVSMGRDLYSKGLDQSDELEADRNGVALATRAGFDPYGLVAVLDQLRSASPDNPMFTLMFSTHPTPQLRLDQLEAAMGQRLDSYAGAAPVPLARRVANYSAAP